jgi:glycosyltransferase involved in cell wall biosynthesis
VTLLSVIQGPAFGGAHNQALRLRPLLECHGISTVVALPEEAEPAARRLREGGVETVTLPLRRLRASANPALQARFVASIPGDVRRLRQLIRSVGADVVQVHGVTNGHGAAAARLEGAALVWQLFDTRAPMLLRRVGMPAVIRSADVITTWGEELARVHPGTAALGPRVITVYPPVDGAEFAPDPIARREARVRLGISRDEILIGSIGVLNPQKGHEYLIRAAELISRDFPAARFVIFGGASPAHDEYERSLREEAQVRGLGDHLAFVDPGTEVAHLLQAIDVFAMTSVPRSEGMPTVILEAMNCRKPIVTTRVGAVAELVDNEHSALIVEPEDPRLIADAILRVLRDPALRERLATAAFDRAHACFDLEGLAALHASAYRLALSRRAMTAS